MAKQKKFVSKTTTVKISVHVRDKVRIAAKRERRSVRAFVDHNLERAADRPVKITREFMDI